MGYKTEKKIPSIILSVFIVLLILVGTIVPAYAAPTQDMMVTDSGEMLSDREEQEVSEMLYSINRQTGIEYLVYTIKSLNGEDIETCANRLFRTAGLGDKEKDNGLLLLISYDDRKFRLEVGYGLEGDIPDTQAANIINTMTPYFKESNYADGVKAAVKQTAVILNSSGEYTISEDWAAQAASNDEANQTSSLIAAGLVLGICYLLLGYTFWLNWPETKENFYNLWKSGKFKPFKEKKPNATPIIGGATLTDAMLHQQNQSTKDSDDDNSSFGSSFGGSFGGSWGGGSSGGGGATGGW